MAQALSAKQAEEALRAVLGNSPEARTLTAWVNEPGNDLGRFLFASDLLEYGNHIVVGAIRAGYESSVEGICVGPHRAARKAQAALQAYMKRLEAVASPSDAAADVRGFMVKHQVKSPLLLNCRPAKAQPSVPVQLLEPSFQRIVSAAWPGTAVPVQTEVTPCDYDTALCLCHGMCAVHEWDRERCRLVQDQLQECLGSSFIITQSKEGAQLPDLMVRTSKQGEDEWLLGVQVRKELCGMATEPSLQGQLCYAKYVQRKQGLLRSTLCPALLMEVPGPQLRITGMAFACNVVCQPLTPMFNLLPLHSCHRDQVLVLAHTLAALREVLLELALRYDTSDTPVSGALPLWGLAHTPMPYHLHQHLQEVQATDVERLSPSGLVYRVTCKPPQATKPGSSRETYIAKYVQQYGEDIHKAWAGAGYAPDVLRVVKLPGWLAVFMKDLDVEEGWFELSMLLPPPVWEQSIPVPLPLQQLGVPLKGQRLQQVVQHVVRALRAAHKVPVPVPVHVKQEQDSDGSCEEVTSKKMSKQGVHGDVSCSNVFIKLPLTGSMEQQQAWLDAPSLPINFIDFDLAGCVGVARYPPFLNPMILGVPGVQTGKPIQQEHDEQLLLASLQSAEASCSTWPGQGGWAS